MIHSNMLSQQPNTFEFLNCNGTKQQTENSNSFNEDIHDDRQHFKIENKFNKKWEAAGAKSKTSTRKDELNNISNH